MVIVQQGPLLAMFPSVTHVVLGERNKYVEKSDREQGREEREIIKGSGRETNWGRKKNALIRGKDEESNREGGEKKTKGMEGDEWGEKKDNE